ncbi:hypothetical protein HA402_000974 [Bradysia odoriphaga]|nr:hypothetical protein HA402_000974 [Bradysia odoriphaga]
MRHPFGLTILFLAIGGTVLTVDGLDIFNLLSQADKFFRPKNNEKVIDGLKKDNELLTIENEALNATNIELSGSLDKEKEARENVEKALEEEKYLVESLKQAIDQVERQLVEAQQQLETSNQQHARCRNENELLTADMEQLKYELNAEIKKLQAENADCQQARTSLLSETRAFVTDATAKQNHIAASLKDTAIESSAIEALFAAFASTLDSEDQMVSVVI